jgi:pyruvate/2-oxoglutarate dehydrogenase complex dihydrolipoamide dehydrogenase (E3) component
MSGPLACDVIVLGLGPGGEYAAQKLAEAGLSVVGVERDLVGGECPFYGCIPSKMMIRAADLVAEVGHADELAGPASLTPDWSLVSERIRKQATNDWNDESHVTRLSDAGVRIVRGEGRLAGPGRVRVGDDEYVAARGVVLNTGTAPAKLPIDGLEATPYWTNREVMRAGELPGSLIVIGGGPIGCELAQVFSRFGSDVTVLEVADRIMAVEEPETSSLIAGIFADEGITVRAGVEIDRVDHVDGSFVVRVDGVDVRADQLLVAAGRSNNIRDIGLETVGLDPAARSVETDERMRAAERLWAVGDITGHGAFTHVSMYQGEVAVADILGSRSVEADYRAVARVTFTDPEVGSVGLTEAQARERGLSVRVGHAQLPESTRGWIHQVGNDGLIKLVADASRGVLVGATAAGPAGGEILGLLALAVHAEVPVATIGRMHFAYPTFHRAIASALEELDLS